MNTSLKGFLLALGGVLLLTPDTALMRLSQMEAAPMIAWRGLLMGASMLLVWALTSRDRRRDLRALLTGAGLTAAAAHALNSWTFAQGIAAAPVAIVLIAVATTPVFAAVLSWALMGERTRRATWVATAAVMAGIVIAVAGDGVDVALGANAAAGAVAGLAVSLLIAVFFVVFRKYPDLPVLLCVGTGAALSGTMGVAATAPGEMLQGGVFAIAFTGLVILPVSFWALSAATRLTQAANVSLLLLLETVLGPLWVWLAIGEAPGRAMLLGGAVVVASLAIYIHWTARRPLKKRARSGTAPA